jgi:hypothetical protein
VISAASRPRPELNRRHFLGHLTATALGVPALQFFSSLNANADQARKNHRKGDSCRVVCESPTKIENRMPDGKRQMPDGKTTGRPETLACFIRHLSSVVCHPELYRLEGGAALGGGSW